jgi:hypothetical protein
MEPLLQATEVVRQAEGELRQLLLRTAEQGDYETARMLAEWANHLKQMVQQNGSVNREPRFTEEANGPARSYVEARAFVAPIPKRSKTEKARPKRAPRKKPKNARAEYPKFLREGEELLKIGWSKREKTAYRHKAPKQVVLLVVQALQVAGKSGERFTMDQVLPIRDPESDDEVPTYQAYLSLAWLRKEQLIVQHGREGYSVRPDINLMDAVAERWKLLPKS